MNQEEMIEEINRLRAANIELRAQLAGNGRMPHVSVKYSKEALDEVSGWGSFRLKRIHKDTWHLELHNEKIELYNRKGRRVRGVLGFGNDGDW
jgi:hypothetical protein